MKDTEMIIFSANGQDSSVTFYKGIGKQDPILDEQMSPCYETSWIDQGDMVSLTASRPLECDIANSYVI